MFKRKTDKINVENLYYTYRKLMYAEAYTVLRENALAEDAVNESFIRIMHRFDKLRFENEAAVKSFLSVVCRNVARDIYSKRKSEYLYVADACEMKDETVLSAEDIVIDKENLDNLVNIISNLDEKYKDILILRRVYKLSREDISKITGLPVCTVAKRLQRAKQMIKEELRKEAE